MSERSELIACNIIIIIVLMHCYYSERSEVYIRGPVEVVWLLIFF